LNEQYLRNIKDYTEEEELLIKSVYELNKVLKKEGRFLFFMDENQDIFVTFKTAWLKYQHTIVSPQGIKARIMSRPEKVANGYKYKLKLWSAPYLPLSEITTNTLWSMVGGANVSESYSSGNESNKQMPGKLKNQIGILRKSYEIGGNVSNRQTVFQFNMGGKTTNYYLPFEEWQHEMNFKQDCEENLWESEYNRDAYGNITMIDEETQLPIPMGAGLKQQIPHKDFYGTLSFKKF
jgi:hypothetical protein